MPTSLTRGFAASGFFAHAPPLRSDRLLEMSSVGPSRDVRGNGSVADQIAEDAALAMALQSEEAVPLPAGASRVFREGGHEDGERAPGWAESMTTQSLLDMSWDFARSLGAEEEDEPLNGDDTERVIKGAAGARADARSRGPCATGLHRRQPWDPAAIPID